METWTATTSRMSYASEQVTARRRKDIAFALASTILFTGALIALKRPEWVGAKNFSLRMRRCFVGLGALLVGWNVVVKPILIGVLHANVFSLRGYEKGVRDADWDGVKQLRLVTARENEIHARLIEGNKEGKYFGEYALFSCPKGVLYDQFGVEDFRQLQEQGIGVLVYHPPQYGRTPGIRTWSSDIEAGEVCYQYLAQREGVSTIHLIGWSIGSGAVAAIAEQYQVEEIILLVPFARLENVVQRSFGRLAYWLVRDLADGYLGYRNDERLVGKEKITIFEGSRDTLMTVGLGDRSEAQRIKEKTQQSQIQRRAYGHSGAWHQEAISFLLRS